MKRILVVTALLAACGGAEPNPEAACVTCPGVGSAYDADAWAVCNEHPLCDYGCGRTETGVTCGCAPTSPRQACQTAGP